MSKGILEGLNSFKCPTFTFLNLNELHYCIYINGYVKPMKFLGYDRRWRRKNTQHYGPVLV